MKLHKKLTTSFWRTLALMTIVLVVFSGYYADYIHTHVEASRILRWKGQISHDNSSSSLTVQRIEGYANYHSYPGMKNEETYSHSDGLVLQESTNVKTRLDERMRRVLSVCRHTDYSQIKSFQRWSGLAFGRLTYCSLPKAGTTFLSRDLSQTLRKLDDASITTPILERNSPKRFFLVREPYSRLVSAFFSKIVGHPYWWGMVGYWIVGRFRPNPSFESVECGHDVTFAEYIKFVIDMHKEGSIRDPHFLRIMEVCNVCADVPDYIAKLETVKGDMQHILNSVNVTGNTNMSFIEVKHLASVFMKTLKRKNLALCTSSMCSILNRYWYGQQATGLISENIQLPVKGRDCEKMTEERLAELAWFAHIKSLGKIDKRRHRVRVMTELFRSVPMEDRRTIQRLLSAECELFGYDPQPNFVFPELKT